MVLCTCTHFVNPNIVLSRLFTLSPRPQESELVSNSFFRCDRMFYFTAHKLFMKTRN